MTNLSTISRERQDGHPEKKTRPCLNSYRRTLRPRCCRQWRGGSDTSAPSPRENEQSGNDVFLFRRFFSGVEGAMPRRFSWRVVVHRWDRSPSRSRSSYRSVGSFSAGERAERLIMFFFLVFFFLWEWRARLKHWFVSQARCASDR